MKHSCPEEICKALDIKDDYTYKEAEDVYISEAWAFKEKDRELFLEKVSPVLSLDMFELLTPEEKREWVIVAVLIPLVRRYLADDEYCPTYDEESELSDLEESKLVEQDGSETIEFDISDLFVEE